MPANTAFVNKNNVAFTGIKEETVYALKLAKTSYNGGAIHLEIKEFGEKYSQTNPDIVKETLGEIIKYYKNPTNHLSGGSDGIIKRCTEILEKIT